ncbi:hypothetical protein MMC11_006684 [Xylographa trunciseda]|nr:hypothetical protein [Xylographa trunciseda]
MSSDTLILGALIKAKGGEILKELMDCDKIFVEPYQPDQKTIGILSDLWLDGNVGLPRAIESRLLEAQESRATPEAYKDLYTTMIFHGQNHDLDTKPLLVRRYATSAKCSSDEQYFKNCHAQDHWSFSLGFWPERNPPPASKTSTSWSRQTQASERRSFQKVLQNAGLTGSSRDPGISGSSIAQTTAGSAYTDFIVDVQYWLSDKILEPESQKRADNHVPKLFFRSHFYAPYLTVFVVKDESDMEEYRDKLIAASSICLYQTHRLFKSSEENQIQVIQEAGSKPLCTSQKEYKQRSKFHFGILMGGSGFEVYQLRPKLLEETTNWNGFKATRVAASSLKTLDEIKVLLHWVSSIHRWGVTKHLEHFQTDLAKFPDRHATRQSLVAKF